VSVSLSRVSRDRREDAAVSSVAPVRAEFMMLLPAGEGAESDECEEEERDREREREPERDRVPEERDRDRERDRDPEREREREAERERERESDPDDLLRSSRRRRLLSDRRASVSAESAMLMESTLRECSPADRALSLCLSLWPRRSPPRRSSICSSGWRFLYMLSRLRLAAEPRLTLSMEELRLDEERGDERGEEERDRDRERECERERDRDRWRRCCATGFPSTMSLPSNDRSDGMERFVPVESVATVRAVTICDDAREEAAESSMRLRRFSARRACLSRSRRSSRATAWRVRSSSARVLASSASCALRS